MNVDWRFIDAIPVPPVLTAMAASTVHVGKALKVMGSTAQVQSFCTVLHMCLERSPSNANTLVTYDICKLCIQNMGHSYFG